MSRTKTMIGLVVGGFAALLIVGTALAHPGGGIVHRVEVLAEALGITTAEVETAKEDGTLEDLLADVTKDNLWAAYETSAPPQPSTLPRRTATSPRRRPTA